MFSYTIRFPTGFPIGCSINNVEGEKLQSKG